jgi:thiamine-monophosphate kinase
MMTDIQENKFINFLTSMYTRSPLQLNALHESDAEIIHPWNDDEHLLALTTDSIVEEIATGLYNDPYLIGWMIVMVNFSDLAAVGANPIGIVVSEIFPKNFCESSIIRLQKGIHDACNVCGVHILGGDTNYGEQLVLTGSALGFIPTGQVLTRKGCHPGDIVYSTSRLGAGNSFALAHFLGSHKQHISYKPVARIKEGQVLRGNATACMDTSDGVLATLDQLMRINSYGFQLDADWELTLDKQSRHFVKEIGFPSWLLLAGEHGEFELLFTLPPNREQQFLRDAARYNFYPIKIGAVIPETTIYVPIDGENIAIDTAWIRNLSRQVNSDIKQYIQNLLSYHDQLRKGAYNYATP